MILPVKFVADWTRIGLHKQRQINKSNKRENRARIDHKYKVGNRVLLTTPGKLPKVRAPRTGPYTVVVAVHCTYQWNRDIQRWTRSYDCEHMAFDTVLGPPVIHWEADAVCPNTQ